MKLDKSTLFAKSTLKKFLTFSLIAALAISVKANHPEEAATAHGHDSTVHEAHADAAHGEAAAAGHADAHGDAHGDAPFDAQAVIFSHIGDSHGWHLWGDHDHAVTIPLPVILYVKGQGLETFMSSAFHHGSVDYKGKYNTYRLPHGYNKIKVVDANGNVDEAASENIIDFSITKNVTSMFLSIIIILWIFLSVARSYSRRQGKAPKGLQSFMEPIILFIRDEVAMPNIGAKYQRYMPFLLTIFFFILVNNLLGLIPAGANLTGNIAVTLVLGVITLLVTNISANKAYWKHILMPPVPVWLWVIMIPVELIGVLSKPFALIVRLFANITAGHIIVISLISLIFIFKSLALAPVSVAFVVFMDVLELLVAFLQAFIFTMLTALFIGSAIAEHDHEHEHAHEGHH